MKIIQVSLIIFLYSINIYISKIPKGHVWIEGDNKLLSNDSRNFGPVPVGLIHGIVEARIWPPNKFQRL